MMQQVDSADESALKTVVKVAFAEGKRISKVKAVELRAFPA